MAITIHIPEPILANGRVDLRGGKATMSQHLLDRPNIGSFIEEIRGKRMPKLMRMQPVHSQPPGIFLHSIAHAAVGEGTASGITE